jgi:hypothetical protein
MNKPKIVFFLCVLIATMAFITPRDAMSENDDFGNMEFLLDQLLKSTEDPQQRAQILTRFVIKALGLLYKQNAESNRLSRENNATLNELLKTEMGEKRELEEQLRDIRNHLHRN